MDNLENGSAITSFSTYWTSVLNSIMFVGAQISDCKAAAFHSRCMKDSGNNLEKVL